MEKVSREIVVKSAFGLHLRPVASLVRKLSSHDAQATVGYRGRETDARNMLGLLALGAGRGTRVTVSAHGRDAQAALQAIEAVLTGPE